MGEKPQVLLVIAFISALFMSAARAADGQDFWLWSGVKTSDTLRSARTVYLHQGDVIALSGSAVFERKGLPVSRLTFPRIWLTVRLTTLDVSDEMLARLNRLLLRWQAAGNNVAGLQIDFDAATHRLDHYAQFLHRLREILSPQFALGVTGLLDWAKTGSVKTLNALPVDELVVQSYQGRNTVADYTAYLPALAGLRIPFKVGRVQNGVWDPHEEQRLAASPWYRGTVVFMLNP